MNILFITRKFPPMKGGMESVAFELYTHMLKISNVRLISYGGSNKFLPIILPLFFLKALWNLFIKKIDIVYLQDGLLSPLGVILKLSGKPVAITIHGLDITYKSATMEECIKRGVPIEKITIIPNGVSDKFYINEDKAVIKERLSKKINLTFKDKKIILSVGRLVERKGIHWFIENVMPGLIKNERNAIYLIAGDGEYRNRIKEAISKQKLEQYVIMLGRVDDETLKLVYNAADVFVMPNISVQGDMEGFGVVLLEAMACGTPIIGSGIEGITDIIKDGETGLLVRSEDPEDITKQIIEILSNERLRQKLSDYGITLVKERFSWNVVTKQFIEIFSNRITI